MTRAPERPLMRKRGPASGLVEIKSYGKEAARRLDNDDRMVLFLTLARSKGHALAMHKCARLCAVHGSPHQGPKTAPGAATRAP